MVRSARPLDFVVIGTQKGGTTSLWQYLRSHPLICLPDDKEAPFFFKDTSLDPEAFADFIALHFADAPAEALLGKVTPHYMMGNQGVSAEVIAERITSRLPNVRLIALLRDPIERAISHFRMSNRRGIETRSFDQMVQELLVPEQLKIARRFPTETTSYLVQGEYGRILAGYRCHIPASRLHVEFTQDLVNDPAGVVDRVLVWLGLEPGHRAIDFGVRHHRGGLRQRVDDDAERQLRAFLAKQVWPRMGEDSERIQHAFNFFFQTWNIVPDDEMPALSMQTRERLEEHYSRDARELASVGIQAPWLTNW